MAVFKFIGDAEGHGPSVLHMFGLEFPKGEEVTVENKKAASKLNGNGHFEEVRKNGNRRRSSK